MSIKLQLLTYDKHNNLLFKVKNCKALFIIDFKRECVRLLKGRASNNMKKKLRTFLYQHYDLKF